MSTIRPCRDGEREAMLAIVNAAAHAYRGVIPADRWHEPYMGRAELDDEIAAGVVFWGCEEDGELVGVMGTQEVADVELIRHAYVLPAHQGRGVGGALLAHLRGLAERPMLVGTWADAVWAIRFYERHGFALVPADDVAPLLRRYWSIPERQIETSVVLADRAFATIIPGRMEGAAISVSGLVKRYGEHTAVDGVAFDVRRGEAFGILGPNGAGKTTTLEMIEGLREPDAGDIEVLGQAVWPHPERIQARIGVQLQSTSLFDRLTAFELLELYARFYDRADAAERAALVLRQVGLESKSGEYAQRLSGGQQQRLAIALALVHDPEVVFLDEPTTGLDPQARRNLWEVIRSINEDGGKTVVLTTHYLEEAEVLCDRVAIMDEARIVALDTPAGLISELGADARVSYADAAGEHTVYTSDAQTTVLEVLEAARTGGSRVENLSVRGPSLEDVFLRLTGREFRE